jgi:hypothetical protein
VWYRESICPLRVKCGWGNRHHEPLASGGWAGGTSLVPGGMQVVTTRVANCGRQAAVLVKEEEGEGLLEIVTLGWTHRM